MNAALRNRGLWARIGVAVAIALIGGFVKDLRSGPTLPDESTNLRRVGWSGALAEDGSLAVEVRYEFLAEALRNDPDRPRAALSTDDGAVRTQVNGRPAPVDAFNRVAPATNDDLTATVAYEVPWAARRVGDQVLLDVSAVSPLHWLYNNYGYAEVKGVLHLPESVDPASVTLRVPGARDVRVDHEGSRIIFSGRVSTYDQAGIIVLLPADVAPDATGDASADGRSAQELFGQAADERSPGRVPDGAPHSDSG